MSIETSRAKTTSDAASECAKEVKQMTSTTTTSLNAEEDVKPMLVSETGRVSFPIKLHQILGDPATDSAVISWLEHGKAWKVHNCDRFEAEIIPKYFELTKFTSFTRQVNGWGFRRITRGSDKGGFFHEFFLRDQPELCTKMRRLKKKDGVDPFFAFRNLADGAECPNGASWSQIQQQQQQMMMFGGLAAGLLPMQHPSLALSQQAHIMSLMQQQQQAIQNGLLNATNNGISHPLLGGQLLAQQAAATTVKAEDGQASTDTNAEGNVSITSNLGTGSNEAGESNNPSVNDVGKYLQFERIRLQQAAITAQRNAAALQMQADLLLNQMRANGINVANPNVVGLPTPNIASPKETNEEGPVISSEKVQDIVKGKDETVSNDKKA